MFQKEQVEEFINILMSTGADFAEVFEEDSELCDWCLLDSKINNIETSNNKGVGFRIVKELKTTYASISNPTYEEAVKLCQKLSKNYSESSRKKVVLEKKIVKDIIPIKIPFDKYKAEDKIKILKKMDQVARKESKYIYQVDARIMETKGEITIANSNGLYVETKKNNIRLYCSSNAKKGENLTSNFVRYDKSMGYEILEEVTPEEIAKKSAIGAVEKLSAIYIKGGYMPAIITNGFGALLIHEACGHGLEATAVAPGVSVFSNLIGKKVASSKVTLVDDPTIPNEFGSYTVDDEGNPSQKHILITKGILKDYLVDYINGLKMNHPGNHCGRRQNYKHIPTSRMSNTYIEAGTDKIDDMIKSIDYGIYATSINSGSVQSTTGNFNFSVDNGFLIEKGKLTKRIKRVSLIGNSKELLQNIEMVSDDLKLEGGYCGSKSGIIPITAGQPTVKVSSILVGGMDQ